MKAKKHKKFWIHSETQSTDIKDTLQPRIKPKIRFAYLTFTIDHPRVPMSDWLNWILLAADSFMVENAAGRKSVIAGYHWFEAMGQRHLHFAAGADAGNRQVQ